MIYHSPRSRPERWRTLRARLKRRWAVPFIAFEWLWEWVAFALSNWRFLEVLEYLSTFSVLVGVILYFSEAGDRTKLRHYQAWQVINTAQGKGGSGGRIEALQELNHDRVPLIGVDVSSAYLRGLRLEHASLVRSNFSDADVRDSDFRGSDFADADLRSANFRNGHLERCSFEGVDLEDSDLTGSHLQGASFDGTDLQDADLTNADLSKIQWRTIRSIKAANIEGIKHAPAGFVAWALSHGAVQQNDDSD